MWYGLGKDTNFAYPLSRKVLLQKFVQQSMANMSAAAPPALVVESEVPNLKSRLIIS